MSITVRDSRTVAAGATDTTALDGTAIANLPWNAKIDLYMTQSATGLEVDLNVDTVVVMQRGTPNINAALRVTRNEDLLASTVGQKRANPQFVVRNPTVGALTYELLIEAKPIR